MPPRQTGNTAQFAAGVNARPTEQNKRQMTRKQVIAVFYHTENLIF